MIEAITFDLWQTLIRETSESARKVKDARIRNLYVLLQNQGYEGSLEKVEAAHRKVGDRLAEIWARHEDVGAEGQVRLFLEALEDGVQGTLDRMALANLEWAYVSPVLQALPVLSEGASELLNGLREQYRLGLICNTGRTPGTMLKIVLQQLGILEFFDVLTFSDAVGVRKPDPRIFQVTLEQLGVSPNRALHVGDDPTTDIVGAQGVGMRAVLLSVVENSPSEAGSVRVIGTLTELPRILQQETEGVHG